MTSGPAGIFGLAPLFLAALPAGRADLTRDLPGDGPGGLMLLALLPAATTAWAAAQIPAVLNGGSRSTQLQWVPSHRRWRSTCGWTRWPW